MEVLKVRLIDHTQFNPQSKYFDPRSSQEKPRWDCVEVRFKGVFTKQIELKKGDKFEGAPFPVL